MAGDKKTAIVTGAASGIGRAMTLGLLGAGIDVAAVDRDEAGLAALAATVQDRSGVMQAIPADLARPDAFDTIVSAVLSRSGRIDVLVNNAGIGQASIKPDQRRNPLRFWEIAPEHWQRFLAVNATGPIMMARAVVPHMLAAGAGRVITVTTSLGTMVREGFLLYGASKAAAEAAMAADSLTVKESRLATGARVMSSHTPSTSRTRPRVARSRPVSKCLAPSSPVSSQMLRITSMSPWGIFSSRSTRIASKMDTMPALSERMSDPDPHTDMHLTLTCTPYSHHLQPTPHPTSLPDRKRQ
jgi:NAD(P)-dependent dehydrogenase (short-subunit alcohol dehydrogenase family)